ncbi:MAG: hypothetical protein F6K56_17025 [Moorea sp. SIO3G5]|nr:hypothetical protein [Moorena sp. SIO3G5]
MIDQRYIEYLQIDHENQCCVLMQERVVVYPCSLAASVKTLLDIAFCLLPFAFCLKTISNVAHQYDNC